MKKIYYTKEKLEPIIKESSCFTEVFRKLGLSSGTGNYRVFKKYVELYNIDISHFDPYGNYRGDLIRIKVQIPLEEILVENSYYSGHLKERLYKTGLKERKCEICGQGEEWMGRKMSLILDHINGISNDNRIENLRIVCPNCNATLNTHCKGKNGLDREKKKRENKIKRRIELNISKRKVQRPPFEELKMEVKLLGLEGVGRKYGVTGNSIKKWIKTYEKYGK